MNAYDRRVVHQTLADDPEVETVSTEDRRDSSRKRMLVRLRETPAKQ
jgi:predicted RNA-binding protein Jag